VAAIFYLFVYVEYQKSQKQNEMLYKPRKRALPNHFFNFVQKVLKMFYAGHHERCLTRNVAVLGLAVVIYSKANAHLLSFQREEHLFGK